MGSFSKHRARRGLCISIIFSLSAQAQIDFCSPDKLETERSRIESGDYGGVPLVAKLETLLKQIEIVEKQKSADVSVVKALTSLIEPIMLMVMGVVVGVIVLAIFYPILQLQSAVRGS